MGDSSDEGSITIYLVESSLHIGRTAPDTAVYLPASSILKYSEKGNLRTMVDHFCIELSPHVVIELTILIDKNLYSRPDSSRGVVLNVTY